MTIENNNHVQEMEEESKFSIIWFIPLLTLLITGWFLYKDYINAGIKITLELPTGEQIVAGKTPVKYLGVEVGKVIDVTIDKDTPTKVDLIVRLRPRASVLAVEGTKFWLVKPVLSLKKISGLETLVSGHYIAVNPPVANRKLLLKRKKKFHFHCLDKPPQTDYKNEGEIISFNASSRGSLDVGSSIFFKDIKIGQIINYKLNQTTKLIEFSAIIYNRFKHLLSNNYFLSRINPLEVQFSSDQFQLKVGNFETLLYGGIELSLIPKEEISNQSKEQDVFLYENKKEAEEAFFKFNHSKIITLYTDDPMKIRAGTPVYLKHIKVGKVKELTLSRDGETVFIKAVIFGKYRKFIHNNSLFWRINNFNIELKDKQLSISNTPLSDFITGGIAFINPSVKLKKKNRKLIGYKLFKSKKSVDTFLKQNRKGLRVVLYAPSAYSLSPDDPVYFRSIQVGHVEWSKLSINAQHVLIQIFIEPIYSHLIHKNTKFWNLGGINTQINLSGIKVKTTSIESIIKGGISFAVPNHNMGRRAKNGDMFYLYQKPQEEWLTWAPKL